jgi:hypothetical protein
MQHCRLGEDDGIAAQDDAGLMVLRALGHHGDDGIMGSGRMTALWAWGWHGSMASWARVHSVMGSGRTPLLQAQEWHDRLGDDVTDSGQG